MEASVSSSGRQTVHPSELLDITKFTVDFNSALSANFDFAPYSKSAEKELVQGAMGICDETYEELNALCSRSSLLDDLNSELNTSELLYNNLPDDVKLASVKMQKMDVEKRIKNHEYKRARLRKMKYKVRDLLLWKNNLSDVEIPPELQVEAGTAVLTVRIHEPFCPTGPKKSKVSSLHTAHVYQVLGTQYLTDLRDKIRCVSDLMVEGDFSQNPDLPSDICARDVYKSAFFFIEGKFYNDFRDPDCKDYSKLIMDWASSKPRGFDSLESTTMEKVKFEDLSIRLGQPYLFMHQGNCEHLLIFSDLRMHHPNDVQDSSEYPTMMMRRVRRRTLCAVCQHSASRWVTMDDELAPENPCYFCDSCFKALHYDEHGKKVCQFQAYKYFDNHVVL